MEYPVPSTAISLIGGRPARPRQSVARPIIDPSRDEQIALAMPADAQDVDAAVDAAAAAQPGWWASGIEARVEMLASLADRIEAEAEAIAWVESVNSGMTLDGARGDVRDALRALRSWPALVTDTFTESTAGHGMLHRRDHLPYGVVGRLVAFNHPFLFAVKGSVAALLAGNAVVLKPADPTPLSAMLLGDLVRDVLPAGIVNVIVGDRRAGEALVRHPAVRRIAFTGSTATGLAIQASASAVAVKSVTLELGGKNPMIVHPDADLSTIGQDVVSAMSLTTVQGQSCGSMSRILLHRDIHDEAVERIAAAFEGLRLGIAYEAGTDMGPVVTAAQRARVLDHVERGLAAGARLVSGGAHDQRIPARGHFIAPTLLTEVDSGNPVGREEVFGPVVSVFRWAGEDEAVRLANDTEYGLTASIWSADRQTALRMAGRIEAGYVWINHSGIHYFGQPFGGMKNSGLGREECVEELRSYLQTRAVHIPAIPGDLT